MLVWATYTVNRVVEVPDDASDSDITKACAAEAPVVTTKWFGITLRIDSSENRSKIDSREQSIVKAE